MTNGLYYPARATRKMRIGITRKEYEKGFWETDKLINTVVGIGNEMARLAISDGIKTVEQSPFYKHQVKKMVQANIYRTGTLRTHPPAKDVERPAAAVS